MSIADFTKFQEANTFSLTTHMEVSRPPSSKIGKTPLLTITPPASKKFQDDHDHHDSSSVATAFDLFYSGQSSSTKSSPTPILRSYKSEGCPLASEERISLLGDSCATVLDFNGDVKGDRNGIHVPSENNNRAEKDTGIDEDWSSGAIKDNGIRAAHVSSGSVCDDKQRCVDDEGKKNGDSNFKRNGNPLLTKGGSGSLVNEAIRADDSMSDKTRKGEEVPSFQTNGKKVPAAEEEDNESCKAKKNDNPNSECVQFNGGYSRQFFAAFAANFGAIAIGSLLSWTSPALPDLRERKSLGEISSEQETWISAIALLGAAAACPVVGFCIERFGRRRCLLLLSPLYVAGWVLITFAQNVPMIYAGRFLSGFCGGGGSIAIPVYVTESASANIRGMLASGFDMMITVGILYIFVVGTFVSWEWQAVACGIIPVVFHLLMLFVPESPTYLVEQGRQSEASRAIQWLRGASSSQQVESELQELNSSVNESRNKSATWADLLKWSALKPTTLAVFLMVFQQLAAIDAVMFYTVDIFTSSGADINENLSANIVGAVQVLATITAAIVVDRGGRRLLLLISEIFMVLSLGTMGIFFYLKEENGGNSPANLGWVPLTSLMVYVVAFSVGMGPLPWLLMGELLPLHIKGKASGIVTVTRWLLGFAVTFLFQFLKSVIGDHGCYWFFSSCCILGTIFVYVFIPETKGKSLDEIQQLYFSTSQTAPEQRTNSKEKTSV